MTPVSASWLVTVMSSIVPTGTLTSGPGISGAFPSSAKTGSVTLGPAESCGNHSPRRTSSRRVSTPASSRPAGTRFSLGVTRVGAVAEPAGRSIRASADASHAERFIA